MNIFTVYFTYRQNILRFSGLSYVSAEYITFDVDVLAEYLTFYASGSVSQGQFQSVDVANFHRIIG